MTINIIVAMDKNGLIGADNKLPWNLPADLRYFKRVTQYKTVVMGMNTYKSIGKPLPHRENIVLTRQKIDIGQSRFEEHDNYFTSLHFLDSIDVIFEMDAASSGERDFWIIGGTDIYRQFLPYADNLFITEIDHEFEGDSLFPEYDKSEWNLLGEQKGIKDEENPYDYSFKIYTRQVIE